MLRVLHHDLIRAQLRRDSSTRNVVVFGSNLGWQCFFAALMYGVEVHGFEIVQHRFDAAVKFADRHNVRGVIFHMEDARQSKLDWSKVGLVYMTDLLWDQHNRALVQAHFRRSTGFGTVLISNRRRAVVTPNFI